MFELQVFPSIQNVYTCKSENSSYQNIQRYWCRFSIRLNPLAPIPCLYCLYFQMVNVATTDLQLRPYRTDDFITKLYYETSRFSAFNYQWVIKAHVNDSQKSPEKTCRRTLSYQLIMKSKIENPFQVNYLALKGPYGEMQAKPAVYDFEFTKENTETPIRELPIENAVECNKLLAMKNINMRLILFQVPKKQ